MMKRQCVSPTTVASGKRLMAGSKRPFGRLTPCSVAPTCAVSTCTSAKKSRKVDIGFSIGQVLVLAEMGDPVAQHTVGTHYSKGTGGATKNLSTAAIWYQKAAEGGNDRAQFDLALLLENGGKGIRKDSAAAMSWYLKCMQQGSDLAPSAAFSVALMWRRGANLPGTDRQKMLRKSHSFMMLAADAGEGRAMVQAAANFFCGRGVEKDRKRGIDLLIGAARLGQVEAHMCLKAIDLNEKGKPI